MNAGLFASRPPSAITRRTELPAHGDRMSQVRFDLAVPTVTTGIRA
jgi:hypothetical protein